MPLSIRLPQKMEQALSNYCASHAISKSEAIKLALDRLLSTQDHPPTSYELGQQGFGADETHAGEIARNTKQLLGQKFHGESAG